MRLVKYHPNYRRFGKFRHNICTGPYGLRKKGEMLGILGSPAFSGVDTGLVKSHIYGTGDRGHITYRARERLRRELEEMLRVYGVARNELDVACGYYKMYKSELAYYGEKAYEIVRSAGGACGSTRLLDDLGRGEGGAHDPLKALCVRMYACADSGFSRHKSYHTEDNRDLFDFEAARFVEDIRKVALRYGDYGYSLDRLYLLEDLACAAMSAHAVEFAANTRLGSKYGFETGFGDWDSLPHSVAKCADIMRKAGLIRYERERVLSPAGLIG